MSQPGGRLYVVSTPIGNLGDITARALEVLGKVDLIAAEDTRHSRRLLSHYGIATPLRSLHEHNERAVAARFIERLRAGEDIALISDAGTPLLSDPGYYLVREARREGIEVLPVPGPSALTAALSVAGLATDRFSFEGFLPTRSAARKKVLEDLRKEPRTMVFYEAPHRLVETLEDLARSLGPGRRAVLARELTKAFETIHGDSLEGLCAWVGADPNQRRGECVLVIEGASTAAGAEQDAETQRVLRVLSAELPRKQAVALTARITGEKKNRVYTMALEQDQANSQV